MGGGRKIYWSAQIIGWASYAALVFLATYAEDPAKIDVPFFVNIVSLILLGIASTHLMRYFFLRSKWLDLKLFPLIPRVFLASLVCSAVISLSTQAISFYVNNSGKHLNWLDTLINVFALLILILFWNSVYFTFHFFQKSRQQELNNISLEASRNEIELKNLLSQLNPHFLFNSLNSIRALIDIEPIKAKDAVTTLSALLRKSLVMGKEELVPLSSELEMVDHYLQLEKVRFEERLKVVWDTDDSMNDLMIPPFSLQTLVENAIKHGISHLVNGGTILIRTSNEKEKMLMEVSNSGELKPTADSGIGIANTRRRLDLQFKGKAHLELLQVDANVVARLTIQK
jgi:sensor histidine kinase YesM